MPVYLILYSVGRFCVEFLRGDHNPTTFGILSDQQVLCIVTLLAGVVLFLILQQWSRSQTAEKTAR